MIKIRALPCDTYPLGVGKILVRTLTDGRRIIISQAAGAALQMLHSFDTMANHRNQLRRVLQDSGAAPEQADIMLRELASFDLLLDEPSLLGVLPQENEARGRIDTIGIITSDRVIACSEALVSVLSGSKTSGRSPVTRIFNDSRSRNTQADYTCRLTKIARSSESRIFHATRKHRKAFADDLATMGFDSELIDFALLGVNEEGLTSIGSNRNCLLLDTAGMLTLSCDDDMLYRVTPHPLLSPGPVLGGHGDPRDYWFFPTRAALNEHMAWEARDILGDHENLLGRSLNSVIRQDDLPGNVQLAHACDHIVSSLHSTRGRVLVTIGGVAGDSGGRTNTWLSRASGVTQSNCLASSETISMALRSREVLGVSRAPTVTHHSFCQTANIGMDNRHLLPPFLPVGRGEDTLFGALSLAICPDSYIGHLPYAMCHNAQGNRSYEQHYEYRIAEVVTSIITSFRVTPALSRRQSLVQVGRYLQDLTLLSDADFWNEVCHLICCQTSEWMKLAHLRAERRPAPDCPPQWIDQLTTWYTHCLNQLQSPDSMLPREFAANRTPKEAKRRLKKLVADFGKLLCQWADIYEAAVALKRRGVDIAVQVV